MPRDDDSLRLSLSHGRSLSLIEIQREIELVLGAVPLKAFEEEGRILLDDGVNARAEVDDRSLIGVTELLYDWAVFVGLTNEKLEDFLAMIE